MAETDSESKTKSDVYFERNLLALAFVTTRYGLGFPAGWWPDSDDVNGEAWAVVWTNLYGDGSRQVGWHVPMEMVPEYLPKVDPDYDGYSTPTKNGRLREYVHAEGA